MMRAVILVCCYIVGSFSSHPEENLDLGRTKTCTTDLHGGDMKLDGQQIAAMEGRLKGSIKDRRWLNGIVVYEIDSSLSGSSKAMQAIREGFEEWTTKTCITFKKRTNEAAYVSFFKGSGCWSYVGRTGKKQQLSLASGCWTRGIVAHEIGHALGLFHEQSRPDRDNYVTIKYENIMKGAKNNFQKHSLIDSLGTPYDYASVMHYGAKYFSKNGLPTIVPKKAGVSIGNRQRLSVIDAQQMNLMYECSGTATTAPPTPTPPPTTGVVFCTFDSGWCSGWRQKKSDKFDWTLRSGSTLSPGTGPSSGHGGTGKYIYIEASRPRQPNDNAKLSFTSAGSGKFCMTFYYHMYGKHIGTLNVYSGSRTIFTLTGNQGNAWKKADLDITASRSVPLTFEGVRGGGYRGDIAIDDFSLRPGSCSGTPQTPAPPVGGCGSRPSTSRIVGGVNAKVNSWPWQAMLTTTGRQFCGGSLVHPLWVVTAAHCVTRFSPSSVKVKLGAHYRVTGSVGTEQVIDVTQIISHTSYQRPVRYAHDIALLKLAKPAVLGKGVGLVCLSNPSNILPFDNLNKKCWITGWGTLSSGGSAPNQLQQASVPLVSKSRCSASYPGKIHDSMLCAGLDQGGVDSCQGDSGGPLVCEFNGKWHLEGVTSWGYGCAAPRKYGVYAKVGYLRSWILSKIGTTPPTPGTPQPPSPTPACVDNPKYADICPSIASCGNYCNVNKLWAQKHCPKSCNMCPGPLPPTPLPPTPSSSCGRSPMTRVIGGVDASPGNWPWQIALLRGSSKTFSCGGSLIAPDWIVTAAHCIARGQSASYYTIRLGDHNRNVQEGPEQDIRAKRVIVHPQYGKPVLNNDIALIQLSRPATLNARVGTVCLPAQDEMVAKSATCYITGWGKIKHPGNSHHILQQAKMPPVTNNECSRKLATSPDGSSLTITANMLCAGVSGTNLSGCHGDSGGPYVCQAVNGNWVLQGDVSWGSPRCSAAERYTVFGRIAKFRKWIDLTINS